MARTHIQHEINEHGEQAHAGIDPANLPDNAIYMSVDGFVGFLPMIHYDNLSAAENVAINEGRKQIALRKAQTVARNAAKANSDVRSAVQNFLSTFSPDAETEFQTVAGKRAEIAREMLKQRLAAAGKPSDDGTVEKNLAAFMAHPKHGASVRDALAAWATAYVPPKKRRAGEAAAEGGADVELDDL